MKLRSFTILKYLVILLFSFELLAPSFIASSERQGEERPQNYSFTNYTGTVDYLSALLYEENSSEERESKDSLYPSIYFFDVLNDLEKFKTQSVPRLVEKERFDTQPSLYTLHRVLRI
jgi:hypothetical protein